MVLVANIPPQGGGVSSHHLPYPQQVAFATACLVISVVAYKSMEQLSGPSVKKDSASESQLNLDSISTPPRTLAKHIPYSPSRGGNHQTFSHSYSIIRRSSGSLTVTAKSCGDLSIFHDKNPPNSPTKNQKVRPISTKGYEKYHSITLENPLSREESQK